MSFNPLHPQTRAFLSSLYAERGAHLVGQGVLLEDAKAEAGGLAISFSRALGWDPVEKEPTEAFLEHLEDNVICRELSAGVVPEEFRRPWAERTGGPTDGQA